MLSWNYAKLHKVQVDSSINRPLRGFSCHLGVDGDQAEMSPSIKYALCLCSLREVFRRMDIIGTSSRPGPEAELVSDFLDAFDAELAAGEKRTIMIEPRLCGARPDIVIIDWDPSVVNSWSAERSTVSKLELQLLQDMFLRKQALISELNSTFARSVGPSLERLFHAGLLDKREGRVVLPPLEKIFAIRKIASFEAKISSMSQAIDQAFKNTWFSSESYILTYSRKPTDRILSKIRARGVGLWLMDEDGDGGPFVRPPSLDLPQSYGSWILNEWIWRNSEPNGNAL